MPSSANCQTGKKRRATRPAAAGVNRLLRQSWVGASYIQILFASRAARIDRDAIRFRKTGAAQRGGLDLPILFIEVQSNRKRV
jgi:hypothetical protein